MSNNAIKLTNLQTKWNASNAAARAKAEVAVNKDLYTEDTRNASPEDRVLKPGVTAPTASQLTALIQAKMAQQNPVYNNILKLNSEIRGSANEINMLRRFQSKQLGIGARRASNNNAPRRVVYDANGNLVVVP
jgi:hypothetical protein